MLLATDDCLRFSLNCSERLIAAAALRPVQGRFYRPEQCFNRLSVARVNCQSDRCRDPAHGFGLAFDLEGADEVEQGFRSMQADLVCGLRKDKNKGLAAEPAGDVAFPDVGLKHHAGSSEDGVARVQAVAIGQLLEIIQ